MLYDTHLGWPSRESVTTSSRLPRSSLLHATDRFRPIYDEDRLTACPLLFVRPRRAEGARWAEFDFVNSIWKIPAERMKTKRPHRVPLASQTLALLKQLEKITGANKFLFPAAGPSKWMSANTLNLALRRLGYAKEELSISGLRTTAATLLSEMGIWNPHAIGRQLTHVEPGRVRRAYLHAAEYWEERGR